MQEVDVRNLGRPVAVLDADRSSTSLVVETTDSKKIRHTLDSVESHPGCVASTTRTIVTAGDQDPITFGVEREPGVEVRGVAGRHHDAVRLIGSECEPDVRTKSVPEAFVALGWESWPVIGRLDGRKRGVSKEDLDGIRTVVVARLGVCKYCREGKNEEADGSSHKDTVAPGRGTTYANTSV